MYEKLVRQILFLQDPESAHERALRALEWLGRRPWLCSRLRKYTSIEDRVDLLGMTFLNRVGLAAGFDKDAMAVWGIYALGFGFMEVGSVGLHSHSGNPRPRLFRLPKDLAIVNRMGLPTEGADRVARRLRRKPPFPVFVNVAPTAPGSQHAGDPIERLSSCAHKFEGIADVVVLNLSCPNTPDGRSFLEDLASLQSLLRGLCGIGMPILCKLSPDSEDSAIRKQVETCMLGGVAGFVAANTTLRHHGLHRIPEGGVSGAPLFARALQVVRVVRATAGERALVVACGGLIGRDEFNAFLDAGADLVEAYTGFVYRGPLFVRHVLAR